MIEKLKLSYSRLSALDRNGPNTLIEKYDKKRKVFDKGKLVNDLLFDMPDFNKNYHVKLYENPTATTLKLANIIIENYVKIPSHEEILEIITRNEFWVRTKNKERLIEFFDNPEFWEYLEISMGANSDKVIVTPEMLSDAEELVHDIKMHKHTRHLFRRLKLVPELPFEIDYKNVTLRGIVDIVSLDNTNKTIRIIDLKTGAKKHSEFQGSFIEYRYYLQEAVYMLAINEIKRILGVEDYTVLPFQFLYVSHTEKLPVLYEVDETWHNAALRGFTTKSGYNYKGLDELIELAQYHHKHKVFDLSKELHSGAGVLQFKSNTIEVQ